AHCARLAARYVTVPGASAASLRDQTGGARLRRRPTGLVTRSRAGPASSQAAWPDGRLAFGFAPPSGGGGCRGSTCGAFGCFRYASIKGMGTVPSTLDTGVLRRLRLARDAMDREWAEPLDVAAVAARAGYSRYHFVRLFSEVYGETPGAYLARRRIERAQDLLRTANLTVTEICMLVGFTSLGTFCTRFKQQVGMTPTEYRRRARAGGAGAIPGCFVLLWAGAFR